jgi:hypothetical protein
MIVLEMIGGQLVLNDVQTCGSAAMQGTIEGVKDAAGIVAQDVAEHTPVKTGRARESVVTKLTQGGKVATVRYDLRKTKAFYMRFLLLGAKAHLISPKQRTARGRSQARRKRQKSLEISGMSSTQAATEALAYASTLTRKSAMHFNVGRENVFTRTVRHPGVRPMHIISESMKSSQGEIVTALQEAVRKNVERAHAQRTSYRGGRIE